MTARGRTSVAGLVLAGWLATAGPAGAIPFSEWWMHKDPCCPRTTYSPCHYWTPRLYQIAAYCHPHLKYIYAKDYHPDIPLRFAPIKYPCPYVYPAPFSTHYLPAPPPVSGEETTPPGVTPPATQSETSRQGVTSDPAITPPR